MYNVLDYCFVEIVGHTQESKAASLSFLSGKTSCVIINYATDCVQTRVTRNIPKTTKPNFVHKRYTLAENHLR